MIGILSILEGGSHVGDRQDHDQLISLPYTFKIHGMKHYAFYENFEVELSESGEEKTLKKGFNFYIFDQHGFEWSENTNVRLSFVKDFADGEFLKRPAWEADGVPLRKPLERYRHVAKGNWDLAYALETVYQQTGLDLLLILSPAGEDDAHRYKDHVSWIEIGL